MIPQPCVPRVAGAVPFMAGSVPAGFPSPAEDYLEQPLDFNELLIQQPAATFAIRVAGDSMTGAGIFPGDIAVVNRAAAPQDGDVILALLDGAFTLKRLRCTSHGAFLEPANPTYQPIPITAETNFEVWGVVKHSIRVF